MTSGPRVAVGPAGTRDWVAGAVVAGGGVLVEPADAEALVWTDAGDPDGLLALLAQHPGVRWVQLPWAGIEPYARAGVFDDAHVWTSGKGVYARPVAEHALMLALAGLRDIKRYAGARAWSGQAGISLIGGRVTVFGGGGITAALLRLLAPFGCHVTVVRKHPGRGLGAPGVPLVERVLGFPQRFEALRDADVVFLALALTPETTGLIGEVELELMAPHAWLVNVARGAHVVTEDLVIALRGNVIGGAALDVTDPEPLPAGHPLWALPNCLVTPHTANTEAMAVPLLSARVEDNVRRYARGEPLLGVVDPALGY